MSTASFLFLADQSDSPTSGEAAGKPHILVALLSVPRKILPQLGNAQNKVRLVAACRGAGSKVLGESGTSWQDWNQYNLTRTRC